MGIAEGLWIGALSTLLMAGAGLMALPRAAALLAPLFYLLIPMVAIALQSSAPLARLLPCVAGWLLAMPRALRDGGAWWFVVAGISLGVGVSVHPAGIVTSTLLLAVGLIASLLASVPLRDRRLAIMVAGFLAAGLPLIFAFVREPGEWGRLATSYGLYDGARYNVLQGMREMSSWVGLVARSEVYYDYFNPSLWFLPGGSLRASLAEPRTLLMPFAVLIPAGLHRVITAMPGAYATLMIAGLLVTPVAAALTAQPPTPARLVIVAPFAALLAMHGSVHLAAHPHPAVRGLGFASVAAVPLCYAWSRLA